MVQELCTDFSKGEEELVKSLGVSGNRLQFIITPGIALESECGTCSEKYVLIKLKCRPG